MSHVFASTGLLILTSRNKVPLIMYSDTNSRYQITVSTMLSILDDDTAVIRRLEKFTTSNDESWKFNVKFLCGYYSRNFTGFHAIAARSSEKCKLSLSQVFLSSACSSKQLHATWWVTSIQRYARTHPSIFLVKMLIRNYSRSHWYTLYLT